MTTPPIPDAPSGTPHAAPAVPTMPSTVEGLGWLLQNFLDETPCAEAAVVTARDGVLAAAAGLHQDKAEHTAAVVSSLHGSGKGVGMITAPYHDEVEQIIVQLTRRIFFVMSTHDRAHGGQVGAPSTVGTFLGVMTTVDADLGLIGTKMNALIESVCEHLVTAVRDTGDTGHGNDR